jgi:hypothetical protein
MQQQNLVPTKKAIPVHFHVIVTGNCAACKKEITNESRCFALGFPFHCLVHSSCLPFFNFKGGWPHEKPMQLYESQ